MFALLAEPPPEQMTLADGRTAFFAYCAGVALLGLLAWLIQRFVLPRVHRFWPSPHAIWQPVLTGMACALVPQIAAVGGAALSGAYRLAAPGWQPYIYVLHGNQTPAGWMVWLFFAVQSTFEELLFRGIGLALLACLFEWLVNFMFAPDSQPAREPAQRRVWFYSGLAANLVICAAFAAVHRHNPAVTPAALWNIALAGFALGQLYWLQGNVWGCCAMHIWWNAGLATLGLPVSGITLREPLLGGIRGSAPGLLTGGSFGPEASVLTTAGLMLVSGWLVWQCWRQTLVPIVTPPEPAPQS
jgi:hypothetical protein